MNTDQKTQKSAKKNKQKSNIPMRRCIGCRTSFPQDQLMRFTMHDSVIIPDTEGKNEGRGIYLCREQKCIDTAIKRKAFCRACRAQVDMESIERAIETALKTN